MHYKLWSSSNDNIYILDEYNKVVAICVIKDHGSLGTAQPLPMAIGWANIGTLTCPEQRAATTGAEDRQMKDTNTQPSPANSIGPCCGRQSAAGFLLSQAEVLERQAKELRALSKAIEGISGEAECTLYRVFCVANQRQ